MTSTSGHYGLQRGKGFTSAAEAGLPADPYGTPEGVPLQSKCSERIS
jgi:hypothetical protein